MIVLYEYNSETNASKAKNSEITKLVLCPSYKISHSKHGHVECDASFHPNACNTTVTIYLEVWVKEDRMLQSPSREIFIDCDPDAEILNR